jgi:hypothetical protein
MKRSNRFVVEVRAGVALFFNRLADVEDGWWWGSDADPLQVGPFESCELALADARRGAENFKVFRWDAAGLGEPDRPFRPHGHVVVIDTDGRLWVKPGERPARDNWKPAQ